AHVPRALRRASPGPQSLHTPALGSRNNRRARANQGGQARAVQSIIYSSSWVSHLDVNYRDIPSPSQGEGEDRPERPFLASCQDSHRSIAALRYHFASGATGQCSEQSDVANHRRTDAVGKKVDGAVAESKVGTTGVIALILTDAKL